MTITTPAPNTYAVQCDRCGMTHELTARTADGGIIALGWRVIGHRQHACPECVEKGDARAAKERGQRAA